jgi:hypothetical protein
MNRRLRASFTAPLLLAAFAMIVIFAGPVFAVRPFVTDDARVVGYHQAQVETSVRYSQDDFTNLTLAAVGPTANSELTIGFSNGFPLEKESNRAYSITGPLVQFKYLFWDAKPNSYPGFAMATGTSPPWGKGEFRPEQWNGFVYAAMTESLFDKERVLIHANIGISTSSEVTVGTWGIGSQVRLIGGLHAVMEIFCNDPYSGKTGGAFQVGFRHIISDSVQIDLTGGSGIFGSEQMPSFVGMGIRFVSDKLW